MYITVYTDTLSKETSYQVSCEYFCHINSKSDIEYPWYSNGGSNYPCNRQYCF